MKLNVGRVIMVDSNRHRSVVCRYLLLLGTILALSGCGGADTNSPTNDSASSSQPNFQFSLDDNFAYSETRSVIDRVNTFYADALAPLNEFLGRLESPVVVIYKGCGVANAFYNRGELTITLCSELYQAQVDELLTRGYSQTQAETTSDNSMRFILYHEIGHVFMDMFEFPVVGNAESTADAVATVLLIETGLNNPWQSNSLLGMSILVVGLIPDSYWHAVDDIRSADVICWALGGLLEPNFDHRLLESFNWYRHLDGRDCVNEYQNQLENIRSWTPDLFLTKF